MWWYVYFPPYLPEFYITELPSRLSTVAHRTRIRDVLGLNIGTGISCIYFQTLRFLRSFQAFVDMRILLLTQSPSTTCHNIQRPVTSVVNTASLSYLSTNDNNRVTNPCVQKLLKKKRCRKYYTCLWDRFPKYTLRSNWVSLVFVYTEWHKKNGNFWKTQQKLKKSKKKNLFTEIEPLQLAF